MVIALLFSHRQHDKEHNEIEGMEQRSEKSEKTTKQSSLRHADAGRRRKVKKKVGEDE